MFYSKSTGGFYISEIHGERVVECISTDPDTGEEIARWTEPNPDCKIPADAVPITLAEHAALLAGQTQGKSIIAGADGRPVLADPPPLTREQEQAVRDARLAQLRAVREQILNRLTGIASRASRLGDTTTATACDVATQGLLDITQNLPVDLPAIELEVLTRYRTIAMTASAAAPGLITAFAGVDL